MRLSRRSILAGALLLPAIGRASAQEPERIVDVARANGFRFGAAVHWPIADPVFRRLFEAECDLITPENAMKVRFVRPERAVWNFSQVLEILSWVRSFDAGVRGHPLIHPTTDKPAWLMDLIEDDPAAAREAMLEHVTLMASVCRNNVVSFDVVNEAIKPNPTGTTRLRDDWLFEPDDVGFIVEAFVRAREAAPGVELVYNDWIMPYADELHEARRCALIWMLEQCRSAGAPIDAVGIQSHLDHRSDADGRRTFDAGQWRSFLNDVEHLVPRIAITELSAPDCFVLGSVSERDEEVAGAVLDYLTVTLEATSIRDIVCWGISDAHTHYHSANQYQERCERLTERSAQSIRALPYDDQFARKPMAEAIKTAMRNAPARS